MNALIKDGTDPNESPHGFYGKTALQAAAFQGHLDIVHCLLAAEADVNAPGGEQK